MTNFRKSLEEKANELAAAPKKKRWDKSIPSILQREIALTIDQIKHLKQNHDQQLHNLLLQQCSIGTDLLQLKQRIPRYMPYHFPEKEKLKQRLFDIEKERRTLNLRLEDKIQSLEDKLLSLINKHEQLDV